MTGEPQPAIPRAAVPSDEATGRDQPHGLPTTTARWPSPPSRPHAPSCGPSSASTSARRRSSPEEEAVGELREVTGAGPRARRLTRRPSPPRTRPDCATSRPRRLRPLLTAVPRPPTAPRRAARPAPDQRRATSPAGTSARVADLAVELGLDGITSPPAHHRARGLGLTSSPVLVGRPAAVQPAHRSRERSWRWRSTRAWATRITLVGVGSVETARGRRLAHPSRGHAGPGLHSAFI